MMRNVDGKLSELRFLVIGQSCPGPRPAPVVDESLHAAAVVAADDAAIDSVGNGDDFTEQMRFSSVGLLQDVEAARLDERQRTQALGVIQCESQGDFATVGMADEMGRRTVGAGISDGRRLLGQAERAGAIPSRPIAVAVESSGTGWNPTS